jgi:magnesium-transporting ATPase (P-type)
MEKNVPANVKALSSRAERAHKRFLKAAAKDGDTLLKRIVGAFINPFTVVLIVLAVVSLFTDVIFVEPGEKPDVTAVVIIVVMEEICWQIV